MEGGFEDYTSEQLLEILAAEPERLSPNALLRPIFQDALLPTAAYVGGPAEVAYFAQSAVLYERMLGRVTPVLPRFSATLIEPAITAVMAARGLAERCDRGSNGRRADTAPRSAGHACRR